MYEHPGSHTLARGKYFKAYWDGSGEDVYGLSYRARAANGNASASTKRSVSQVRCNLMPKFEKHIFICGNQRPPGSPRGCCDPSGQAKLQKLFKQKLAERGLKGRVRANQSGCLDQCEHGPNLVVYPDAVWYGHVTEADVDEIIESHILGGQARRAPDAGRLLPQHGNV